MNTSIGLIATGDELTQGDILNTNGQYIVLALNELGFTTAEHLVVSDEEERIASAINYFKTRHDIVILTGGLGPTSDDRTRYALAKALNLELHLDQMAWNLLLERLQRIQLPITEENRQQALLPIGAEMLPNAAGTAAGCYLKHNHVEFFMLPGPPSECLPMFDQYVLPKLMHAKRATHQFKWLLLGANEGKIATELDAALQGLQCRTGYRWHYPYLDYKVFAESANDLTEAEQRSLPIVSDYLVSQNQQTSIELLNILLIEQNITLGFSEDALSQLVKYMLIDAATYPHLVDINLADIKVEISGFPEYWQIGALPKQCAFTLSLTSTNKQLKKTLPFYYRDAEVKEFLTATVAKEVLAFVQS
jgi:nicotinamide-nucleotide amidase